HAARALVGLEVEAHHALGVRGQVDDDLAEAAGRLAGEELARLAALRGDADLGLGAALALEAEAEAELPVRGDDGVEAQPAGARQGDGGARRAARGDARAQRGVARRLEGTLDAVAGD